jgi:aconitate hydratase
MFRAEYANIFKGDDAWNAIASGETVLFSWQPASTYVREPPFFMDLSVDEPGHRRVEGARCLVLLGDSVTTDHISPAGAIARDSAAGRYLLEQGVELRDFNSYGSRRGNHEVMMRGTFGNVRLRNRLAPDTEGAWTRHFPSGETMTIYDAAMRYASEGVGLIVIAGSEYGTGSSRDWAAKGPSLLGVKVVIAKSYERIHRSNLIGMGILPVEFMDGEDAGALGIRGDELFDVEIPSHFTCPRFKSWRSALQTVTASGERSR